MTRSELVAAIVAARKDTAPKVVDGLVTALFALLSEALRRGERIELRGFGRFALRTRKACSTRNPRTGRVVWVPPRRTVSFAAGKELKGRLNPEGVVQLVPHAELPSPPGERLAG